MKSGNKICLICNQEIQVKKDNYVHVIDYLRGNFQQEGFFHRKCYVDKLKGTSEVNEVKEKAMKMLNSLGIKLGIEEEEVVKV